MHRVLSLILATAVKDDRLVRNPAAGVSLPRVETKERMYLSHQEIHQLAKACGPYRLVVLFLAYTGVLIDEVTAHLAGARPQVRTMTLDLYGHLFPDQLDEVADRMDAAARSHVYRSPQ